MTPKPIIFDCDPGDDDALALIMAFASSKELTILGITTSSGNAPVNLTFDNARKVCALAGRPEIKVFKGCERPLLKEPFYGDYLHGENGLDGYHLEEPSTPIETKHAVDFIIETLLTYPQPVTVAVTGAMTNIAAALIKEPSIKNKIERLVMMGGARTESGNVTPCAEFNMFVDPHAAYRVLNTLDSIVMISLDITHQVTLDEAFLQAIKELGPELGDALYHILCYSHEADKRMFDLPGRAIHDACVTAYVLNPDLFSGKKCYVTVETMNKQTIGQTIVHWHPMHNQDKKPNCLFLNKVDAQGVLRLVFEKVKAQSHFLRELEKAV